MYIIENSISSHYIINTIPKEKKTMEEKKKS